MANDSATPLVILVTGQSGSGGSLALDALEDCGFYCIDNLPFQVIDDVARLVRTGEIVAPNGVALCMNLRSASFANLFPDIKRKLSDELRLDVVFLTAADSAIATRYSATRRRHPLLRPGDTLQETIERERMMLAPVEEAADVIFDTSDWSPHDLARALRSRYSGHLPPRMLHVTITSFGFKYGQLRPVDAMFDVRFVRNPYFVEKYKSKTGLDADVVGYVFSDERAVRMFEKIEDMQRFLLPNYYDEGKHYFRIGIGCSGGRHRSVAFAERMGEAFLKKPVPNVITTIIHRDIEK